VCCTGPISSQGFAINAPAQDELRALHIEGQMPAGCRLQRTRGGYTHAFKHTFLPFLVYKSSFIAFKGADNAAIA
jgi:hypothetical protein